MQLPGGRLRRLCLDVAAAVPSSLDEAKVARHSIAVQILDPERQRPANQAMDDKPVFRRIGLGDAAVMAVEVEPVEHGRSFGRMQRRAGRPHQGGMRPSAAGSAWCQFRRSAGSQHRRRLRNRACNASTAIRPAEPTRIAAIDRHPPPAHGSEPTGSARSLSPWLPIGVSSQVPTATKRKSSSKSAT